MASKQNNSPIPIQSLFSEQLGIALIVLLFLLATLTWYLFFTQTIAQWLPGVLGTLIGFTFVGVFFFVGATLWHNQWERLGASLALLLPLGWSMPWILALPTIVFVAVLIWSAIELIHIEQRSRIRFQFFQINSAGKFLFVVALCIALSVAYYSRLQDARWEKIVSEYKIGETTSSLMYRALTFITPELKQETTAEETTVDQYLTLQLEQSLSEEVPSGETERVFANNPVLAEQYLQSGRKQLSDMIGREVHGDEPVARVFAEYTQVKLTKSIQQTKNQTNANVSDEAVVPALIALLLFIALVPLASLLGFFWIVLGYLVFLYLLHTKQVQIVEELKPVEALVETPSA